VSATQAVETISPIFDYFRLDDRFPHILCPGCGIGTVMSAMIRAFSELKIDRNKLCVVSGIGCSSRVPGYLDCDTFHTLHGRAIPSATGVKLALPDREVVVLGGDGDMLAIGGNHFIHAARRNLKLTTIVINNYNYGMTGGQFSPTTPQGSKAKTSPYGNAERGFDVCELAKAAGAVFVGRTTAFHVQLTKNLIKQALQKNGFAVVEAIAQCPTLYGRMNRLGSAVKMLEAMKANSIPLTSVKKPEDAQGKIVTGVLWNVEAPEFTEVYRATVARAQGVEHEN
jgi:2-oxoglutarate/2-oxoacid ferredoxin oxidoreductase subunit beta